MISIKIVISSNQEQCGQSKVIEAYVIPTPSSEAFWGLVYKNEETFRFKSIQNQKWKAVNESSCSGLEGGVRWTEPMLTIMQKQDVRIMKIVTWKTNREQVKQCTTGRDLNQYKQLWGDLLADFQTWNLKRIETFNCWVIFLKWSFTSKK